MNFLIENRRFAHDYGNWIQQNEDNLLKAAAADTRQKTSLFDVKMYANIFKQIIKEKLNCVLLESLSYRENTKLLLQNMHLLLLTELSLNFLMS